MGRPTLRFSLIALALAIGWLLLVMLLKRLGVRVQGISHRLERRPPRTRAAPRPPPIRCRGNRIHRTTRVQMSSVTSFRRC